MLTINVAATFGRNTRDSLTLDGPAADLSAAHPLPAELRIADDAAIVVTMHAPAGQPAIDAKASVDGYMASGADGGWGTLMLAATMPTLGTVLVPARVRLDGTVEQAADAMAEGYAAALAERMMDAGISAELTISNHADGTGRTVTI